MNFFAKGAAALTFTVMTLAGAAASAATYTFDFTGSNPADAIVMNFTEGTVGLSVFAGTFNQTNGNINYAARNVSRNNAGLGVNSANDTNSTVDGRGGNDMLNFDFDQVVRIVSVSFSSITANDQFTFGSVIERNNGGFRLDRTANNVQTASTVIGSMFGTLSERTGDDFGFGAIQNNDNYRISALTISTVPLPASGLMLLAAMGLGAGVARRRKSAA